MHLTVNKSMEYVKADNFVVVIAWCRVEEGAYCVFNKIYEDLASMGFLVEVRKLHV